MTTKAEIYADLEKLVSKAFSYAASVELGDDRIAAFELAESLRRMQRVGSSAALLAATNPFNFAEDEDDWDEDDE